MPGPSLPIAALVASGLPAGSFVYLSELPASQLARLELLAAVAVQECTLVLSAPCNRLAETVVDLHQVLGERPLVVVFVPSAPANEGSKADVPAAGPGGGVWRGTTADTVEWHLLFPQVGSCVLVVGSSQAPVTLWDEGQLQDEIRALLDRGLGTKKISQELADVSGWSRRDVYRLAVEQAKGPARD